MFNIKNNTFLPFIYCIKTPKIYWFDQKMWINKCKQIKNKRKGNKYIIYHKSDIKDFYIVTKFYILNKCCAFEFSIHQIILKKIYNGFHKKNCINVSTLKIIRYILWNIKLHFKIYSYIWNTKINNFYQIFYEKNVAWVSIKTMEINLPAWLKVLVIFICLSICHFNQTVINCSTPYFCGQR